MKRLFPLAEFITASCEPKLLLCSQLTNADPVKTLTQKAVGKRRSQRDTRAKHAAVEKKQQNSDGVESVRESGGAEDSCLAVGGHRGRTWEMSITASQLRGLAEVRSLKPSRVEIMPFWSILRIMVPSTKKITPYLSTVMPADGRTADGQRGKIFIRRGWESLPDSQLNIKG